MQASQRAADNHALEFAAGRTDEIGKARTTNAAGLRRKIDAEAYVRGADRLRL